MNVVKKALADLIPNNDKNIRKHTTDQIDALVKSIDSFGIIRPIICDEQGNIICGHGLYEALTLKGAESADCVVVSGLSERQKKKLMLADNKIYEMGINRYDAIENVLKEFAADSDFDIPGYNAQTLESLYGIKSIKEEDVAQIGQISAPDISEQISEPPVQPVAPTPSKGTQEAREMAIEQHKNVIVCPHCGGIIDV